MDDRLLGSSIGGQPFCHTMSVQPSCFVLEQRDRSAQAVVVHVEPIPEMPDSLFQALTDLRVNLVAFYEAQMASYEVQSRQDPAWVFSTRAGRLRDWFGDIEATIFAMGDLWKMP